MSNFKQLQTALDHHSIRMPLDVHPPILTP
jgi:RP/EB family microtubule-associated protein